MNYVESHEATESFNDTVHTASGPSKDEIGRTRISKGVKYGIESEKFYTQIRNTWTTTYSGMGRYNIHNLQKVSSSKLKISVAAVSVDGVNSKSRRLHNTYTRLTAGHVFQSG